MTERSEQSEGLELESEPPLADPEAWREHDPDRAEPSDAESPAEQLTAPGGGGQPGDTEPTEIAEHAGTSSPAGPEPDAIHIEDEEGRGKGEDMAGDEDRVRLGSEAADELADARPGASGEDGAIAGLSWADWPDGLSSRARQVVDDVQAGQLVHAVTALDEMIDDLGARRRTVVDLANTED